MRDKSPEVPVIAYATPTSPRAVNPTSSCFAWAAMGLTALGYAAVLLLANGWLFYGQPGVDGFLIASVPILFFVSFFLALTARGMKRPDLARCTLALFASGGSLLLLGAFLVYGILHMPNC